MANPDYKEGRGDYYRTEGLRDASVTLTGTLTDSGAEWARAVEVEAAGRDAPHGVGFVDKAGIECLCRWTCSFDSGAGGWIAFNRHLRSAPLDVERLARAIDASWSELLAPLGGQSDGLRRSAERIAAEYSKIE